MGNQTKDSGAMKILAMGAAGFLLLVFFDITVCVTVLPLLPLLPDQVGGMFLGFGLATVNLAVAALAIWKLRKLERADVAHKESDA
jgi:hypothetical protein